MSKRLLFAQLIIVLPLAVVTWISIAESLYWRLWWLDIPMHFFGGAWAALCGAWLLARQGRSFTILWCLTFALFIGVVWEAFEYIESIAFTQYLDYRFDTVKDIVVDLIGAIFGWYLANLLMTSEQRGGRVL